ncbi:MAG: 4Fe-4S ferredoxin [Candidatus Omnitrophica bacterium CG_4_10_14_0_8_um_filter_44_12]|nr:MAG: 4Fe-4S ferredoxin [Candidatus Omnitrophica bacterium CG_4_10_14_0_8_um_filter_44_12]
MIEELRNKARELLKTKQVEAVIGYQRASDGLSAIPCVIRSEEEAGRLIWDAACVYNLCGYLKDFRAKKLGIVAKACDVRAMIVLISENQLNRDDVFIIGMECCGVVDEKRARVSGRDGSDISSADKCKSCASCVPLAYDCLIKEKREKAKVSEDADKDKYEPVRKLEAKSLSEKSKSWKDEFKRCIRCYACRQVCPMCYCPRCVADQFMPVWFSKAGGIEGNFSWNVARAMHLAGRCIDCGECERACPVGIPLRDINRKIEKDIKELFGYEAGMKTDAKPFLVCFDKNDPEDFIK